MTRLRVLSCTSCILGFFSVEGSPDLPRDFSDVMIDPCHATVAAGLGLRDRHSAAHWGMLQQFLGLVLAVFDIIVVCLLAIWSELKWEEENCGKPTSSDWKNSKENEDVA